MASRPAPASRADASAAFQSNWAASSIVHFDGKPGIYLPQASAGAYYGIPVAPYAEVTVDWGTFERSGVSDGSWSLFARLTTRVYGASIDVLDSFDYSLYGQTSSFDDSTTHTFTFANGTAQPAEYHLYAITQVQILPVPEPASGVLLLAGLAIISFRQTFTCTLPRWRVCRAPAPS